MVRRLIPLLPVVLLTAIFCSHPAHSQEKEDLSKLSMEDLVQRANTANQLALSMEKELDQLTSSERALQGTISAKQEELAHLTFPEPLAVGVDVDVRSRLTRRLAERQRRPDRR